MDEPKASFAGGIVSESYLSVTLMTFMGCHCQTKCWSASILHRHTLFLFTLHYFTNIVSILPGQHVSLAFALEWCIVSYIQLSYALFILHNVLTTSFEHMTNNVTFHILFHRCGKGIIAQAHNLIFNTTNSALSLTSSSSSALSLSGSESEPKDSSVHQLFWLSVHILSNVKLPSHLQSLSPESMM